MAVWMGRAGIVSGTRTCYLYPVLVPGTLEPVTNGPRASTRGFVAVLAPQAYEVPVPCTASRRERQERQPARRAAARHLGRTRYRYLVRGYRYCHVPPGTAATASVRRLVRTRYGYAVQVARYEYGMRGPRIALLTERDATASPPTPPARRPPTDSETHPPPARVQSAPVRPRRTATGSRRPAAARRRAVRARSRHSVIAG
jgi:hypothetical protein